MKGLSISVEGKATRYDEALEYARCLINEQCKEGTEGSFHRADLQKMFPELQESEDERIRKELLSVVNDLVLPDEQRSRFVAWLEKQGEQELTVIIPKFKAGQTIKYIGDFTIYPEFFTISKVGEAHYFDKNGFTIPIKNQDQWELVEQKLADKVDQHSLPVSDDSSLPTFDEDVFHSCAEKVYEQQPTAWSEEDSVMLGLCVDAASGYYNPDNKEKMKGWLYSLKDRVQPKQEWSKDDEYYHNIILYILNNECVGKTDKEKAINWFKSLRPQSNIITDEELAQAEKEAYNNVLDKMEYNGDNPTFDDGWRAAIWYLKKRNAQPQNGWKPSKEQMEALKYSTYCPNEQMSKVLFELYQDLDKLRG